MGWCIQAACWAALGWGIWWPRHTPAEAQWPKSGYRARYAFRLPDAVDECSGAVPWTDSTFLTHNDDGPAELYEVSYQGSLVKTIPVPGARNQDWEDLTRDTTGTLYIADLGNNRNNRHNLALYRYRPGQPTADRLPVRYADQTAWPPPRHRQNYDCEAVFTHRGRLYAVSKNRGRQTVKVYRLPTAPGDSLASVVDSARVFYPITGAAVSPNGKVLALVAYGMVYLYGLDGTERVLAHPLARLRFHKGGQAEAIWWRDAHRLYVANEAQRVFCFERRDGQAME